MQRLQLILHIHLFSSGTKWSDGFATLMRGKSLTCRKSAPSICRSMTARTFWVEDRRENVATTASQRLAAHQHGLAIHAMIFLARPDFKNHKMSNRSIKLLLFVFTILVPFTIHAQTWPAKLDDTVRFYQTTDVG